MSKKKKRIGSMATIYHFLDDIEYDEKGQATLTKETVEDLKGRIVTMLKDDGVGFMRADEKVTAS